MFNDKEITLLKRCNLYVDENGCPQYDWNNIGSYKVDVQPISSDICSKKFGLYPNVKYQVFLETKIDGFNDDTIDEFRIIYKDKKYIINKIIEYDDEDWYYTNFCISRDSIGSDNSNGY